MAQLIKHGGRREGAERRPKPPPKIGVLVAATDPKAFLLAVMNNADTDAGYGLMLPSP